MNLDLSSLPPSCPYCKTVLKPDFVFFGEPIPEPANTNSFKEAINAEIFPLYRDALNTLNLFEYIIVLYHFNEVERWAPTVNPPASTHEYNFGLFATRSPKRPNPIGISIVKLEKIANGILYISGVDAFDGTPVLDIKPYLPSVDCIKSIQNELMEKELGHHDEDFISDSTFYK